MIKRELTIELSEESGYLHYEIRDKGTNFLLAIGLYNASHDWKDTCVELVEELMLGVITSQKDEVTREQVNLDGFNQLVVNNPKSP